MFKIADRQTEDVKDQEVHEKNKPESKGDLTEQPDNHDKQHEEQLENYNKEENDVTQSIPLEFNLFSDAKLRISCRKGSS